MKKICSLLIVWICLSNIPYAQNIDVLYAIRNYYSPNTNYAEINTSVACSSLKSAKDENGKYFQRAELVTVVCPIAKYDSAVYVDKRVILSPKVDDESELNGQSLLDLQRIPLKNDTYVVYFEIRDLNTDDQPMNYRDAIQMNYADNAVDVADIMVVDKYSPNNSSPDIYTKSGYDLHPYLRDAVDKDKNVLTYYTEIYNADKTFKPDEYFAVVTCIEDIATNKKVESVQQIKRMQAKEAVMPYLANIDLSSLTEGAYYLTVEVRGDKNILYAYKRFPFTKHSDKKKETTNTVLPKDAFVFAVADEDLDGQIYASRPISSQKDVDFMLKNLKEMTPIAKREYLYNIFYSLNPSNPEVAWREYSDKVKYVNEKYSTLIKHGYDTDMGRVYLQYGAPTTVIDEKYGASTGFDVQTETNRMENPEAMPLDVRGVQYYPYQIWVYDVTPYGERNRKFVFYARQNNLEEYFLLHSDARGELQDMYWENVLSYGTLERGVVGKAGKQFQRGRK